MVKPTAVKTSFQASSGTYSVCSTEWTTTGGSCCSDTVLKAFFDERTRDQKSRWGAFFSSIKRLNNNIANIKKIASQTDATKAAFDSLNSARLTELGMTSIEATNSLSKASVSFEADLKALRTSAQNCFKTTNLLRGKVFCIGCNGNSDTNFGANNGIPYLKYSAATCNNLVTTCAAPWAFMTRVQTTVALLVHFTNVKKGSAATSTTSKNPTKMFFRNKKAGEVFNLVDKCASGLSATCLQADMDALCQAFFSFAHGPKSTEVPQADTDTVQNAPTTRLLQELTENDDAGYVSSVPSGGVDLSVTTSGLSSTDTVDLSLLPSNSLFIYVNYLLVLFAALVLN